MIARLLFVRYFVIQMRLILIAALTTAHAMPQLAEGETYEYIEGLLGAARPFIESTVVEFLAIPEASPAPYPAPTLLAEWESLMSKCVDDPDEYKNSFTVHSPVIQEVQSWHLYPGEYISVDGILEFPWLLVRCSVHEELCGLSLGICDWLRDERMTTTKPTDFVFDPDGWGYRLASPEPMEMAPRVVVYETRCDCYFLLFVFAIALSCVAFSKPRTPPQPIVIEAEPVLKP